MPIRKRNIVQQSFNGLHSNHRHSKKEIHEAAFGIGLHGPANLLDLLVHLPVSLVDGCPRDVCTFVLSKVIHLELFDVQVSSRLGTELLSSSKRSSWQDFHTLIVQRAIVPLALRPIFAILGQDIVGINIV